MLWWFFRWFFWRPRFTYTIVTGSSHASAEEAARNAELQVKNSGGEAIGIAADAMCCSKDDSGGGGAQWDVHVLIRK